MNRELVPPQNLYQMPRRPSSRLWRLALPAMRHLLLYRFVPSPRSYRHNRGSTAIVTDSHARRFRAEGVGRRATELGCRSLGGVVMNVTAEVPALLALDAGIRETGWAVFKNGEVIENGVTGLSTRRKVEPEVRISHLIRSLNVLASQWQPQIVTLCQPSGINWPVPALDLLVSSLAECSTKRGLPQFSYTRLGSTCGHRRASQRLP